MKNQFKKSLSLIMAILMLMSCWVWVAPTEADAAGGTTQYYVKYTARITNNWDNGSGNSKIRIYYKPQNGKGTETYKEIAQAEKFWGQDEGNVYTVWEGFIDGFPTKLTQYAKTSTGRNMNCDQLTLYVGTSADNCTNVCFSGKEFGVGSCSENNYPTVGSTTSSLFPYIASLDNPAAIELTLGALGSTTNATATGNVASGKDQYGVSWEATFPTTGWSHKMALDGDGTTTGLSTNNISVSGTSNKPTITATPATQTLKANPSGGKVTYYLLSTYGSATATTQVIVSYPTYTATFDANGGKIGSSDSDAKDKIKVTSSKMYYGTIVGASPVYRAKTGFEFKGFYSEKYLDMAGLNDVFVRASDNAVVEKTTKFVDSETTVPAQGDTTWYAAWKASPITATFMTADNQLIGTVEGSYGNYLTNSNMYGSLTDLNKKVMEACTNPAVSFGSDHAPIYKDGSSTYTFSHWKIIEGYDNDIVDKDHTATLKGDVTFKAVYTKSDAKTYTVSFEDGNGNILKDKNGNEYKKTDYKFRDDVVMPSTEPSKAQDDKYLYEFIGWANNIGQKFYAVDEADKDASGAFISYTSKDAAEFTVRGDASYVPVFRMIPREYKVTFKYKVDGGNTESVTVGGYHLDDVVKMPEGVKDNYTAGGFRYTIDGWKVGTDSKKQQLEDIKVTGDLELTATYGAGQGAEYIINFYDKDGNLINDGNNIYTHNSTVTVPTVGEGEEFDIPQTIKTDDSLYTFAGWSSEVKTTAAADAEYRAQYSKKDYADIHFYNYDGTLIYSLAGNENSLFVGETIPAYSNTVEGENVLPVKEADVIGSYKFTGWADSEGKAVVPGTDKFTGDTYLTAQFETEYKEYSVKFLNDDGTVVSEGSYHYGEAIVVPADPEKAEDADYKYSFRGWTPEVSEVCYGDATYTATYRRSYQHYTVTWLDDNKEFYSSSNYINGAKIQQATINAPVGYGDASQGHTWVFDHWVQCDAEGNDVLVDGEQVIFKRGMKIEGADLYFYPVFIEAENALTVTFYDEDGTTKLGEVETKYNASLYEVAEAYKSNVAIKPNTDEEHYTIDNWINMSTNASVTENNKVTDNVSLKVVYGTADHVMANEDIIHEPTCTETGLANYSCNALGCKKEWKNVVLDVIPDTAAPTGKIYVGSDVWQSGSAVNYADVKYISPNTKLVINAQDLGSESEPWNVDGKLSSGVGTISYYVAGDVVDTDGITNWTEVYNYEEKADSVLNEVLLSKGITKLEYAGYAHDASQRDKKIEIDNEVAAILATYRANATGIASNLNLENGKTYIIYVKVTDREANNQSADVVFSSGKLIYDTEAPEITVTGDGFGTKFCADATIKVTDNTAGLKAYIDGEEITLNNDGEYKCEAKGVHTVEAVDLNGNKTTKTFEIKGNHTYRHYKINATCTNAGSEYDLCTVCGAKANENTIPALGHSFAKNYTDKAATCTADGYRTYVCDNNCGEKLVLNPTDGNADLAHLKATDHNYDGAEWVIDKAATCVVKGSKHMDCKVCGILGRVTEEIPVDTVSGHKFYREKVTLEPTCIEKGQKTKSCRYCTYVEVVELIDALGHTAGEYVEVTAATCETAGSKVLKCTREDCGAIIGAEVEIPALGHAYKAVGEIYEEDGKYYQNYVCRNDETHTKKEEVADYVPPVAATVTFDYNGGKVVTKPAEYKVETGEVIPEEVVTNKVISGQVGDTITTAQVGAEPKKDADVNYSYTFAYWATKNADGSYTEVKFPIEVTAAEMTFYAVYAEKHVNYTITYYIETATAEGGIETEQYKKTGYIHNGETVTLADGPSKAATWQYKYEFTGWKVKSGETVYTDSVTIDGANINLVAQYEGIKKQYSVTYAITSSEILETFVVDAGDEARACPIIPTEEYDSKHHYVFTGWDKAEDLKAVKNNIYTTPKFTAVEHSYNTVETIAATCAEREKTVKVCECGHTITEYGKTADHLWGDPVYDEETGKNIITCQRENCGVTKEDTRKFTAKFYINEGDTSAIKTVSYIPWGTTIEATRLPAEPQKEGCKFNGWAIKGKTDVIKFAEYPIYEDCEFVAVFEELPKTYNVTFSYGGKNDIYTVTVNAGENVTYDEGQYGKPTKAHDDKYHYEFKKWDKSTENVQENLVVNAVFEKIEHTYGEPESVDAKCEEIPGIKYTCTACGYSYTIASGAALKHIWKEINRVEPTEDTAGSVDYKCEREGCDATKTETLPATGSTAPTEPVTSAKVTVAVYRNGAPVSGIKVIVHVKNEEGTSQTATTNANGVATFTDGIEKDKEYVAYVEVDGAMIEVKLNNDGKGNFSGSYNIKVEEAGDADCGCACHRTNFWGTIFRFFHKIIKMFTGEFKCCNNPDPMYG